MENSDKALNAGAKRVYDVASSDGKSARDAMNSPLKLSLKRHSAAVRVLEIDEKD